MNMNVKAFVKKYTMVIALVAVFILFSFLTEGRLLYPQNMSNLMLQNSYVLVLACGMLLCILTGGNIDLSVGSTVCLVGALAAQLMDKSGWGAIPVIFVCLMVGAVIGGWQGFWIGYIHIPPFICTLSGMFLFRGLGRVILKSKTVPVKNPQFLNIFASYVQIPGLDDVKGRWLPSALIVGCIIAAGLLVALFVRRAKKNAKGYAVGPLAPELGKTAVIAALIVYYSWKLAKYKGIPVMLIWVLAVVFIYSFITSKTALGRYFYAVGGNEKATKLSGIDTRKVYFLAYLSMSFLAGLSGLLMAARIASVNGDTGNAFEMDAIGSCFIGGASAYGGSGTVAGICIGAIFLGVINQGMSIIGLHNNRQYILKGAQHLVAALFHAVANHKTGNAG